MVEFVVARTDVSEEVAFEERHLRVGDIIERGKVVKEVREDCDILFETVRTALEGREAMSYFDN